MNNFHAVLRRVVNIVLLSFFLVVKLLAQSGEVSLRGQVTDQSGAVVGGITVTLIDAGKLRGRRQPIPRADTSSAICRQALIPCASS